MEQIPYFEKIAEDVEAAYKIIQNFKNGKYADPKDPYMCRIALTALRHCCRDALNFADESQAELGEV